MLGIVSVYQVLSDRIRLPVEAVILIACLVVNSRVDIPQHEIVICMVDDRRDSAVRIILSIIRIFHVRELKIHRFVRKA